MMIARAALWRTESRGAHYRTDFPRRDDEHWSVHSIIRQGAEITASERIDFAEAVGTEKDGTIQTTA
jgi:succinate dehydrogenase/fumarate reductase flavoprotein subunit